jgi:fatty-acyl-CoA synthase
MSRAGKSKRFCTGHEDDLIAHSRTHLAGYKTPKQVFFVDSLPKNPSGKLLKRELRAQFSAGQNAFH